LRREFWSNEISQLPGIASRPFLSERRPHKTRLRPRCPPAANEIQGPLLFKLANSNQSRATRLDQDRAVVQSVDDVARQEASATADHDLGVTNCGPKWRCRTQQDSSDRKLKGLKREGADAALDFVSGLVPVDQAVPLEVYTVF